MEYIVLLVKGLCQDEFLHPKGFNCETSNVLDQARLFAIACIRLVRWFPSGCAGCARRGELSPYAELHSPRSAFVSTKVRMVPVDRLAEIRDDYRSINPLAPGR